jgi:hypothetical protein
MPSPTPILRKTPPPLTESKVRAALGIPPKAEPPLTSDIIEIVRWTPSDDESRGLIAEFGVELQRGVILAGWQLRHGNKGGIWISPPARKLRRDGQPVYDDAGRHVWDRLVAFRDEAIEAEFKAKVRDAVKTAHPECFA